MKATKYGLLADEIRSQIRSNVLQPGDRLPSFAEMRERYGASPLTVDRVYSTLEGEGLIVRVQGRGTFVAEPNREVASDAKKLIGLVVPDCSGSFFSHLIQGIEQEAQANGYHVTIASNYGHVGREEELILSLGVQTTGLCIFPCGKHHYTAYARLMEAKVPFVFVDRSLSGLSVPVISTDNVRGGYLATRHLLDLGRRKIWVLNEGDNSSVQDRIRGYRVALKEAGIAPDPALVLSGPHYQEAAGYSMVKGAIEAIRQAVPIGIFALNDTIARGAYMALKEAGLRLPDDVAVVGFDDIEAPFMDPPLTTVRQDLQEMGQGAVKLLLEQIRQGSRATARSVQLEPRLVVRNSTDLESDFCAVRHILDLAAQRSRAEDFAGVNFR